VKARPAIRPSSFRSRRSQTCLSGPGEDAFSGSQEDRLARRAMKRVKCRSMSRDLSRPKQGGSRQFTSRIRPRSSRRNSDRGEIIESVYFPEAPPSCPGLPELRVLHLQFDLVNLQFVEQPSVSASDPDLRPRTADFPSAPAQGFGAAAQRRRHRLECAAP